MLLLAFCDGIVYDASTYATAFYIQTYLNKEEPRSRSQIRWYNGVSWSYGNVLSAVWKTKGTRELATLRSGLGSWLFCNARFDSTVLLYSKAFSLFVFV